MIVNIGIDSFIKKYGTDYSVTRKSTPYINFQIMWIFCTSMSHVLGVDVWNQALPIKKKINALLFPLATIYSNLYIYPYPVLLFGEQW